MSALWPGFLLLLGIIPVLIGLYIWMLRRRRRFTVRYSSLSLVREAAPRSNWRRHIPFALFMVALTSLILALARPASIVSVPSDQTTIVLAIDVSRSMCAVDIKPNRLEVAKKVALDFIQREKSRQIGIVAFSGYAEIVVPPTRDPEVLQDAIDSLVTGFRTAVGSGIVKSIDAIAEIDQSVAPSVSASSSSKPAPVPKGTFVPHIIVLLTDGATNAGIAPADAAQQAIDRGIRVYTIGFGTANGGEMPNCNPGMTGSEPLMGGLPPGGGPPGGGGPGFGGGGGGRFRRGIDEAALKKVAEITDAEYYSAESAAELASVFDNLPTNLIVKTEATEISFIFAILGGVFAAMAILLSLIWHPLP